MSSSDLKDKDLKKEAKYEEEWKAALEEVNLPEPAEGKKIISFSLEEGSSKKKPARKRKKAEPGDNAEEFILFNKEDYSTLSSTPRRRAREVSMMMLFAATCGADWQHVQGIIADAGIKNQNAEFALSLAQQAHQQIPASDALLSAHAREWDVQRFSLVDHTILRLAVSELVTDGGANHSIIINEAIELGKKFGTEESAPFINGILDAIYIKELKANGGE